MLKSQLYLITLTCFTALVTSATTTTNSANQVASSSESADSESSTGGLSQADKDQFNDCQSENESSDIADCLNGVFKDGIFDSISETSCESDGLQVCTSDGTMLICYKGFWTENTAGSGDCEAYVGDDGEVSINYADHITSAVSGSYISTVIVSSSAGAQSSAVRSSAVSSQVSSGSSSAVSTASESGSGSGSGSTSGSSSASESGSGSGSASGSSSALASGSSSASAGGSSSSSAGGAASSFGLQVGTSSLAFVVALAIGLL